MLPLVDPGADDGTVKLMDTRIGVGKTVAAHSQHSDFVSDLAHAEGKRALLATSGDGTLSVMDLRSSKVSRCFIAFGRETDVKYPACRMLPVVVLLMLTTFGTATASNPTLRTSTASPWQPLPLFALQVQQSETDADDELLALAVVKGGAKVVVGSQSGMLNIWSWGRWAGFSDRFPGEPLNAHKHKPIPTLICSFSTPAII